MTTIYRVEGMTCGGCARALGQILARDLPSLEVEISVEKAEIKVRGPHDVPKIEAAVESAGFNFKGLAAPTS